ncbi:MAG: hypothetical protein CMK92_02590 [Pseudomonas sp.]|nr:hypothetical protein [Pseudomonas sp.]
MTDDTTALDDALEHMHFERCDNVDDLLADVSSSDIVFIIAPLTVDRSLFRKLKGSVTWVCTEEAFVFNAPSGVHCISAYHDGVTDSDPPIGDALGRVLRNNFYRVAWKDLAKKTYRELHNEWRVRVQTKNMNDYHFVAFV